MLANRVSKVMDKLKGETQTAFVKGRNIADNIVCAQETLHYVRKNMIKGILFKIDFKKVFDRVN
jgi:hypothetical protein